MEAVPRQHRLPHRGRSQLLQRAVSARARAHRGAFHANDRRDVCQRPPGGLARPAHRPRPVFDAARPHAAGPSGARGMDPVPAYRVGRTEWPGHRPGGRGHPRGPAAPRARVPRVPGAHATGPALWRRSTRRRLSPRRAAPLVSLSHRRTHSYQPAGPAPARGSRPCPSRANAREPARRDLLRGDLC